MISNATPFDALFADLSDRMGVLHTVETDPSQRDRVVWENAGFSGLESIGYTMPATVTIGRQGVEYQVSVYGATELEVLARAAQIAGWLDVLIGPPQGAPPPPGLETGWVRHGFKVGKSSKPVQGGDGLSAGWATTLPITLYQPVYSELRPLLTVSHPSVTATAAAGQGATNPGADAWQG